MVKCDLNLVDDIQNCGEGKLRWHAPQNIKGLRKSKKLQWYGKNNKEKKASFAYQP